MNQNEVDARGITKYPITLSWMILLPGLACQAEIDVDPPDGSSAIVAELEIIAPVGGTEVGELDDVDDAAGIQVDLEVWTALPVGHALVATVVAPSGGRFVWPHRVEVDESGFAAFEAVNLPAGQVSIQVSATGGAVASDSIDVTVAGNARCDLSVAGVRPAAYYAPVPVLNENSDLEPQTDGMQTEVVVKTGAEFSVELFLLDVTHDSTASGGIQVAGANGRVRFAIDFEDGLRSVWAVCGSERGRSTGTSATQTIVVDVHPPRCNLVEPSDQSVFTYHMDRSDEIEGTQVFVRAVFEGDEVVFHANDVIGQPVKYTSGASVGTFVAPTGVVGSTGESTGTGLLLTEGPVSISATVEDHAGNRCRATATVHYDARRPEKTCRPFHDED